MRSGGFSLIELLVVILIVGVLGGIAFYNYSGYLKRVQAKEIVSMISGDLERARASAIKNSRNTGITVAADGKSYELRLDGLETTSPMQRRTLPYGGVMTITDSITSLNYLAPYGEIDAANQTISVRTAQGGAAKLYVVGVTGMVYQ